MAEVNNCEYSNLQYIIVKMVNTGKVVVRYKDSTSHANVLIRQ